MDVRGDFLVIGSGIAGRAALTLAESGEVIVLTKTDPVKAIPGTRKAASPRRSAVTIHQHCTRKIR